MVRSVRSCAPVATSFHRLSPRAARPPPPAEAPPFCRRELRFELRKFLSARGGNSSVRCLAPSRSGPSTGFDEVPLSPGLHLLELGELRGRARLLHESRNAGRGQSGDHGRVGSVCCHPLGSAAESPA